jgi:FecR-like protein
VSKILRAAVVVGGVVLLAGAVAPGARAQPRELPAKLVTLGGTAELHRKDTPAWVPATLRADVGEGDSVRTQLGGRATLRTASGQALRLGSRSQIALLASEAGAAPEATRVRLDSGWLWVAVLPGSPAPTHVVVRAGPAVVTIGGAGVGLRRSADGALLVQVHHGTAVCAGPDRQWERTLTGAQQLLVPASGVPAQPVALAVDPLETTWVRWNADQDLAGGYGGKNPKP